MKWKAPKNWRTFLGIFFTCFLCSVASVSFLYFHYLNEETVKEESLTSSLEKVLFDFRMTMRGKMKPSQKVFVLFLGDGKNTPRGEIAKVLMNLKSLGVKWVDFDVDLQEPFRTVLGDEKNLLLSVKKLDSSAKEHAELWQEIERKMLHSDADESLIKAIEFFGTITYTYKSVSQSAPLAPLAPLALKAPKAPKAPSSFTPYPLEYELLNEQSILDFQGIEKGLFTRFPLSSFAHLFPYSGFRPQTTKTTENKNSPWITLLKRHQKNLLPSSTLLSVSQFLDKDPLVIFDALGIEAILLLGRSDDGAGMEIFVDPYGHGYMLLNPISSLAELSFQDVLHQKMSAKEAKKLNGSLIFISDATKEKDKETVFQQAALAENIITQSFLKRERSSFFIELLFNLSIFFLVTPFLMFLPFSFYPLIAILAVFFIFMLDHYLFFGQGTWIYLSTPLCQLFLMLVLSFSFLYFSRIRKLNHHKKRLSPLLSKKQAAKALSWNSYASFEPAKEDITLLLGSVHGYQKNLKNLSADSFAKWLTIGFKPLTKIILESGGLLVPSPPDTIKALFGAAIKNGPDAAPLCGVKMSMALDKVNQKLTKKALPPFNLAISVNKGASLSGFLGPREYATYNAEGEVLEECVKLCKIAKHFDIPILVGDGAIFPLNREEYFIRTIFGGVLSESQDKSFYSLLRPDFLHQASLIKEFLASFNEAQFFLKEGRFDEAKASLEKCLLLKPSDSLTERSLLSLKKVAKNALNA